MACSAVPCGADTVTLPSGGVMRTRNRLTSLYVTCAAKPFSWSSVLLASRVLMETDGTGDPPTKRLGAGRHASALVRAPLDRFSQQFDGVLRHVGPRLPRHLDAYPVQYQGC